MTDDAIVIHDAVLRSAPPAELEPGRFYAFHTPEGVHTVDLTGDDYKTAPSRKQGATTVTDAASWLAYWTKHHDDASDVYADAQRLTVTAVLDAHTSDAARWSGHWLRLQLRKTEAWEQWLQRDGQLLSQEMFAEHIEDHLPELLEPDPATMLEIAQSMQATTKAEFKSGTRLQSGERQLTYVEDTRASAGRKGELTIPATFTVGVVPFEGSSGYKLGARLRYRIQDTTLRIGYKLDQPGDVLKSAFADVVKAIAEGIDVPVMNGTPA
ncbi:DUF2303 family protein [Streptomyces sp. NPDC051940]|uniref:DUF2303 family protein n=1 Tax=Streptomyces sp. NPDC051940 TaxID=3155675 RepID=UPI0034446241